MELDLLLRGVIAPVLAAIAVLAVSWNAGTRLRGVALLVAFVFSCLVQEPIDAMPPRAAWQWVPVAAIAATTVALAAGERAIDRVGRAIACALAASLACVLFPLPEWSTAASRLALGTSLATCSMLTLPIGMHRGGASFWIACGVSLGGTAALVLLTGFAKLAVPVGAVSATCLVVAALTRLTPRHALHAGIAGSVAIVCVTVLGCAAAFAFETADLPAWITVVGAAAPLGMWLGEAPPFRANRAASALARVLGSGVLALAAVMAAASHAQRAPAGGDAYALRDHDPMRRASTTITACR